MSTPGRMALVLLLFLIYGKTAVWSLPAMDAHARDSLTCLEVDGSCMRRKVAGNHCKGEIDETYECPNGKVCCLDGCPESLGFFFAPETGQSQCLKAVIDTPRTWADAQARCQNESLRLARPYNSRALALYIYERYNAWGIWVYAKGDGSRMRWQTNRHWGVPNNSPLWYPGQPGSRVNSSYCMMLLSDPTYLTNHPDKPYYTNICTAKRWTLCQKPLKTE